MQMVVITTTLSAAMGGVTAVSLVRFRGLARDWDVSAMCNGILAGLVSITAGCATVEPWAALLVGMVGAIVFRSASRLLLRLCIDDPLDASAVHGACGCWGLIATALFSDPTYVTAVAGLNHGGEGGLFYGDARLLGAALVFILANLAWTGFLSALIFWGLRTSKYLRYPVSQEHASMGPVDEMDNSTHAGQPYMGDKAPEAAAHPAPAAGGQLAHAVPTQEA